MRGLKAALEAAEDQNKELNRKLESCIHQHSWTGHPILTHQDRILAGRIVRLPNRQVTKSYVS